MTVLIVMHNTIEEYVSIVKKALADRHIAIMTPVGKNFIFSEKTEAVEIFHQLAAAAASLTGTDLFVCIGKDLNDMDCIYPSDASQPLGLVLYGMTEEEFLPVFKTMCATTKH